MAGFREAYARLRQFYIRDCRKHGLHDDPEEFANEKINSMSLVELMNELTMWAEILDEEAA